MSSGNDQTRGGKVFALETKAQRFQQIDKIEAYWNKVRANRLVPSRSEIDPRGLSGALGNAFILERITGGLARFRIAGSHLSELSGLELRQMPVSALFLPGSRRVLSDAMEAVFSEPAVVRMQVVSPAGFGRDRLFGEMILCPLRSDLGDVDRVLGGLVFEGRIGRTPRRIDIEGQTRKSLTGYAGPIRQDTPEMADVALTDEKSKTFLGEMQSVVKPASAPKREISRGHLTLVVSND